MFEIFRTAEAEPALNGLCGNTVGGGDGHEPDAAMDRKDSVAVIESDYGVEAGVSEDMAAKWGTTAIRDGAAGKNEADASTLLRQLEGSFDEELIPIDVRARLDTVDPRIA